MVSSSFPIPDAAFPDFAFLDDIRLSQLVKSGKLW